MAPKVSVFIPYYNDEEFLKESIQSVLIQKYENWELILLNHATKDSCREIAHSYNDPRIKHIDIKENLSAGGGGILMLEFLKAATGKYLKFLCADDILLPNCLADFVEYMEHNPDIDFVFGNLVHIDESGSRYEANTYITDKNGCQISFNSWMTNLKNWDLISEVDGLIIPNTNNILKMYLECETDKPLPYPGSFVRKNAIEPNDIYRVFVIMFDMSLWFTLLLNGKKLGFLNKDIGLYRMHSGQCSSDAYLNRNQKIIFFEKRSFWKIGLKMNNIQALKEIFPEDYFIQQLNDNDVKFIPFCIAHHWANTAKCPFQTEAILYLFDLLNHDFQKEIYKKFNFNIKDLRKLYIYSAKTNTTNINTNTPNPPKNKIKNFIQAVFSLKNECNHKVLRVIGLRFKFRK